MASDFSNPTGDVAITADDFAAFWYDVDDGKSSELVYIDNNQGDNRLDLDDTIAKGDMYYVSKPQKVQSEIGKAFGAPFKPEDADLANYYKMGLFGDEYIALDGNPDELAKLLIEFGASDKKTLSTGEEWELGEGWSLVPQQIDLDGNKVWLQLKKNGVEVDSGIIDTSTGATPMSKTYVYEDSDDRAIFYCYVDAVFRGVESNIVQLKYVFLRSDNVLKIESEDTFGNFDVAGFSVGATDPFVGATLAGGDTLAAGDKALVMESNTAITLDADDDDALYGDVVIHTADTTSPTLRFFLQKSVTVEGAPTAEETPAVEETPVAEETPAVEENVTEENVTAPVNETPAEETPAEETPAETPAPTPTPGFEALFAVAGLLAVSFLVLRRRH